MKLWRSRSKNAPAEALSGKPADEIPIIELIARADITRETFFLLYARLIEEQLGAVNLRFIEDGVLTFEAPAGKAKTTFMENAWLQCKSASEPRVEIIERYLRTLRAIDEEPDYSREQVIAIVKDSEYHKPTRKRHASEAPCCRSVDCLRAGSPRIDAKP